MRPSARRHAATAPSRSSTCTALHGPGVELERLLAPGGQRGVEHVERVDRLDARHEVRLGEAVERAGREATGVDLAALLHELRDLVVDRHVAREGLVADVREATSTRGHEDARPVQDEARVEALAQDARGGEAGD